jgi:hypothetical protein
MSEVKKEVVKRSYQKAVVTSQDFATGVIVSHEELNGLVGQLMQMCDLIGDPDQRRALKDTIKRICRDWLDSEYSVAGYDKFTGIQPGAYIIKLEEDRTFN